MANIPLTAALREEYEALFDTCMIRGEHAAIVERTVDKLRDNRSTYARAEEASGVPWHFIAVIHNMESSLNFKCHLHNGDPLTARTVQVPKGCPKTGTPPFLWENSAADALALKKLDQSTDWTLAGTLYQLERYNGFGYRIYHPEVKSPYLWSCSNHYTSGKYVADGTWSHTAKSKQLGAAVLLRRMAERREIEFEDESLADEARPLIVSYSTKKPRNEEERTRAEDLQRWLNTFPGVFVKVDGVPGKRTSNAYRVVTGAYLPGDPRR